jgi:hypothetical protein
MAALRQNARSSSTGSWAVAACVFFALRASLVQGEGIPNWKTGAALTKTLQAPLGFSWSDRAFGEGLAALSRRSSVAVLLDRRVDPTPRITYAVRDLSLSDALKDLAAERRLSVGMVGSVVYLAPPGVAGRAQGLASAKRRELPPGEARMPWVDVQPLGWNELAEPRSLVQSIAHQAGAELANPEAIPHDVWPAWAGPPVAPIDQLSLLLAQFDLTFELRFPASPERPVITVVPVPASLAYEQSYAVSGDLAKALSELKRALPEIEAQRERGGRIKVAASAADHAKVADLLASKRPDAPAAAKPGLKRYTLTVENQPRGAIVKTVAEELGVRVEAAGEIAEKLQERISVKVQQLSVEELLHEVLDPADIAFELDNETLTLRAK